MAFDAKKFIEKQVAEIKKTVGNSKAVVAMSGGVDSTVVSVLGSRALNNNLTAMFVDTGLMRAGEREQVESIAKQAGINLRIIDAGKQFFEKLSGVLEPERKRKIIGELFIRIFEEEAKKTKAEFLLQGTLAPDWIESGGGKRASIKSHHNVGGLPEKMGLKLVEPLRDCYKHEARLLARALGLPPSISERQPFPGPGLAVRIVGEVTSERAEIVRKACKIVEEEIEKAAASGEAERPWQYFASLLCSKTVGVRGDERAYQYVAVVRAVRSLDGMTANFSQLPPALLQRISTRITNEVRDIGRVVYDVTNKPPGTIELE
ncbi:glutamine-hydrolyzing GMP synthase subunit GuaA [Candidatus Micrarchaeota archaeon]|nr:glutamine-hydrolyzing GMP synthase subunit GuaA [Candidatus Micrarchaeota archaeon]